MSTSKPVIDITPHVNNCGECRVGRRCLPADLCQNAVIALAAVVKPARPAGRGTCIMRQGDAINLLYVVRAGSAKGVLGTADGTEQVLRFFYPGDVIGLDSIAGGICRTSAFAIERTSICEIPLEPLHALCQHVPDIYFHMIRGLADALTRQEELSLELSKHDTERRLAAFLCDLSRRQCERGMSATDLHLTMSRYDIANHLGMASETVSRMFTMFERAGILSVSRKAVLIVDLAYLREVAHGTRTTHALEPSIVHPGQVNAQCPPDSPMRHKSPLHEGSRAARI